MFNLTFVHQTFQSSLNSSLRRIYYLSKPVQLHHVLQKESGPMAEVREITHKEYRRILHGLVSDGNSFRHDEDLKKQYENFRRKYWRWRAREYKKGGN